MAETAELAARRDEGYRIIRAYAQRHYPGESMSWVELMRRIRLLKGNRRFPRGLGLEACGQELLRDEPSLAGETRRG